MAQKQLLREAGRGKLKRVGLLLPLNLLRGRGRQTKHGLWLFVWPEQGMAQRLLQWEVVAPTSPSSHLRETEARGGDGRIEQQLGGPNPRKAVAAGLGLGLLGGLMDSQPARAVAMAGGSFLKQPEREIIPPPVSGKERPSGRAKKFPPLAFGGKSSGRLRAGNPPPQRVPGPAAGGGGTAAAVPGSARLSPFSRLGSRPRRSFFPPWLAPRSPLPRLRWPRGMRGAQEPLRAALGAPPTPGSGWP